MEELRGQKGTYRLGPHVARGRSGDTFRAVALTATETPSSTSVGVGETGAGIAVAIKVHDRADDGRREIERLTRIEHPGVVPLLDHGVTPEGRVWLALPWIEGRSLTDVLASERPFTIDRVHRLLGPLAAAVDALHRAGLIHGDLSPNNVIVGPEDRPTLIDLGGSAELDPSTVDETTGLEVTVTPRYGSPEVAQGLAPGPASDRYALGLIAYEALTGAFPFGEVATPIAMLGHHAATQPVAPSEHRPDLPAEAEIVLLAALAKDPAARPPSAERLISRLVDGGGPVRPRPIRWPRLRALLRSLLRSLLWPRLRSRRRRPLALAAAALLLLLLAVAALIRADVRGTSPEVASGSWPAGRAAGLSCNRLQTTDFESADLPEGFYGADPTNTAALVAGAGVDETAALQVGARGAYGLFGEIVPIGSADRHVFSAWVRRDGEAEVAALYIDYLDASYVQLTAVRDSLEPGQGAGTPTGSRVVVESEPPAGAAFAVPTVFKDGSASIVFIDEVVFGPSETCLDLAS